MVRFSLTRVALIVIMGLALPRPALAYIDPGTSSAVFGSLAYILGAAGVALAFLFRPIKRLFRFLFGKKREQPVEPESQE